MLITSFSNSLIRHIRKLKLAKYRSESGEIFIEGAKFIIEALESNWEMTKLIVAPDEIKSETARAVVDQCFQKGIQIIEVASEVFESLAAKDLVQGIGAIVKIKKENELPAIQADSELWIALENIQDPGNLGAILRTADAAGAKGVILIDDCVDLFDPAVIRASMGAFFSQLVIHSSLLEVKNWQAKNSIIVFGTSDKAEVNFYNIEYQLPALLMMGSERKGLSIDAIQLCNTIVSIPMRGKSDSLNLAVSTGIMLFEITKTGRCVKNKDDK